MAQVKLSLAKVPLIWQLTCPRASINFNYFHTRAKWYTYHINIGGKIRSSRQRNRVNNLQQNQTQHATQITILQHTLSWVKVQNFKNPEL